MHTLFLLPVGLCAGKPIKKKKNRLKFASETSLEPFFHQPPPPPEAGGSFYSSGRSGSCCRSCVNITLPFQPGLFVFFHAVHHTPTRRSACALLAAPLQPNVTLVQILDKWGGGGQSADPRVDSRSYSGILLKSGLRGMCERGLSAQELIKAFAHQPDSRSLGLDGRTLAPQRSPPPCKVKAAR